MPLRRRATDPERHTFDLETAPPEELPADPTGGPGTGGGGPADATPQDAAPPHRRRVILASVAAAALVLGGMAVVDAVTSRQERAALVSAPGGLVSASAAPQVAWEHDLDVAADPFAFVPGALVVSEGDDVVGYDLDTGAEVWRHTFDGPTTCGTPTLWHATGPVRTDDPIVCVAGEAAVVYGAVDADPARPVTLLAADGSVVGQRTIDLTAGPGGGDEEDGVRWFYTVPGPGGAVLWVGRDGPQPEEQGTAIAIDPTARVRIEGEPADFAVALQDVATGEERWRATAPASGTELDPYQCARITGDRQEVDAPQRGEVDLDQLRVDTSADVVTLQGCGGTASFGMTGARLDDPDDPFDVGTSIGGRYVRDPSGGTGAVGGDADDDGSGPPQRSTVLHDDGTPAWRAPGLLLPPSATDGRASPWFAAVAGSVVALDGDGKERWTADPELAVTPQVLVATRDRVVVPTDTGLAGLDAETGEARWTLRGGAKDAPVSGSVTQAFTDGAVAVLQADDGARGVRLVGVDLTTGRVVWSTDGTDGTDGTDSILGAFSAQGHLWRFDTDSVALLR